MKFGVILLLSLYWSCALAEHDIEELVAHGDKCGGTKEDLSTLALYKLSDSPTSKCMYACLSKDYGVRDAEGKYCKDHAKLYFQKKWGEFNTHASVIADKCDERLKQFSPQHDECEYGYQVVKCFHEEMDQRKFFTPYLDKAKEVHEKFTSGVFKITEDFKHKLKDDLDKFKRIIF